MEPESNPLDLLRQRRAINRVEAAMRKTEETPKPGGYRYLGRNADTGQGLVVGNDGSVIPGDIITSGHVKPGQAVRVAQAGGMVQLDQKPRVRKVVPPVAKKEEGGPVKILFSVVEGAERIYYVGGDRRTPKSLFRLPAASKIYPHLVVTGKGLNQFYWQYESDVAEYPSVAPFRYGSYVVDSRYSGDPFNLLSADSASQAQRSSGVIDNTSIFPAYYIGDGQYVLGTFDCLTPTGENSQDTVPNLLKLSIAHYQNGEVLDVNGRGQFPLSWGVGTANSPVDYDSQISDFTHFLPIRSAPLVTEVVTNFAPLSLSRTGSYDRPAQLLIGKGTLGICDGFLLEFVGQYPGFYSPGLSYSFYQEARLYSFLVDEKNIEIGRESYRVVGQDLVAKNNSLLVDMLSDFFNTTGVFKRLQSKFVSLDPAKKLGYFAYDFDFRRTDGNYDWGQNPNLIAGTKDVVNFKKLNFETIELEDLPVKIFPLKKDDPSLQIHSISYHP
jgi:hypothetical protein